MTTVVDGPVEPRRRRSTPGLGATVRVELAKLFGQWPIRLVLLLCVLVPVGFVVVTKLQWPAGPSDTLFGRWAGTTGFAASLTFLNIAAVYGVPLLAGLFAGDMFAGEDRHGTWKSILTRSVSRSNIFGGKAIAATVCVWVSFVTLGLCSLLAGAAITGTSDLVGLSGNLVSAERAWWLVALSWSYSLVPATAFVALGLLLSIASRSTLVGVLGPLVVGGALALLELVGHGRVARTISPAAPFDAWHALFTDPIHRSTLWHGVLTSLVWTAIFAGGAWFLLRRRDFASSDTTPRGQRRVAVLIAAVLVAVVGGLVAVSGAGPTDLTANALQPAISRTFGNLAVARYGWINGDDGVSAPPITATCTRGAGTEKGSGPGSDWACTLVDTREEDGAPPVVVDVDLQANGCFTASAGTGLGALLLTDRRGKTLINPLYAFDGCLGTP